MNDGTAFGTIFTLTDQNHYSLQLQNFKRVPTVLLPRPYPTFLPYYSKAGNAKELDLSQIESLQISIGPGINTEEYKRRFAMLLHSISLQ